ncbi:MAG: SdpI family protein [Peptoniphilaceae bacterium]
MRSKYFKISLFIFLINFIIVGFFYNKLPDQLPTHYNFMGEVDKYSSKFTALFGINLIMLGLQIFCYKITNLDPKKENQGEKIFKLVLLIIPIFTLGITLITIARGLGKEVNVVDITSIMIGILFILLGNYFPKTKRNYTIGIKIPWTLDSDYNWNKTHRFAGYLWSIGGILIIFTSFLSGFYGEYFIFAIVLAVVIIPIIYSYKIYKELGKNEK